MKAENPEKDLTELRQAQLGLNPYHQEKHLSASLYQSVLLGKSLP
jgi:hypothetical protein